MPITPAEAASIAARHGLSLQDAAGLVSLADDVADAEQLAATFAGTDAALRQTASALFGRNDNRSERFVADVHDAIDRSTDPDAGGA